MKVLPSAVNREDAPDGANLTRILAVVITRWVSLGSVLAASSVAVTTILFYPLPSLILPGVMAAVLLDWKHRGNIQRLIHGEEPRLSLRRKKAEP